MSPTRLTKPAVATAEGSHPLTPTSRIKEGIRSRDRRTAGPSTTLRSIGRGQIQGRSGEQKGTGLPVPDKGG